MAPLLNREEAPPVLRAGAMFGRQPWMYRGHEDYDPNDIGAITLAHVVAALTAAGWNVLFSCIRVRRYDLVIEDPEGRFYRVQCKTGYVRSGAVFFPTQSLRAAKKETEWRRIAANYQGEIEYFGVYCPDNGKVYLVPIEDVPNRTGCNLRIDPPKNNQRKRIRWAREYEVISAFSRTQLITN
jgi:hypothetical protein